MEAQKFLEKYEQDQCEYCHGKRALIRRSIGIGNKLVVWIDDAIAILTGAHVYIKRINFCPMCGRELTKEV